MSASSTGDDKAKVSLQRVPTLNVQSDLDANDNIIAESSERGSTHMKLKSGIITEGDSKSRQRSGSRNSSGEWYWKLQSRCVMIHSRPREENVMLILLLLKKKIT